MSQNETVFKAYKPSVKCFLLGWLLVNILSRKHR